MTLNADTVAGFNARLRKSVMPAEPIDRQPGGSDPASMNRISVNNLTDWNALHALVTATPR